MGLTVGLGKHHGDDVDCLAVGEHVPHAWLGLRLGLGLREDHAAGALSAKQGTNRRPQARHQS